MDYIQLLPCPTTITAAEYWVATRGYPTDRKHVLKHLAQVWWKSEAECGLDPLNLCLGQPIVKINPQLSKAGCQGIQIGYIHFNPHF